jgi:hypothetical protein
MPAWAKPVAGSLVVQSPRRTVMRRKLFSCIGGALALGVLAAQAEAFPATEVLMGKVGAQSSSPVEQVHWRWHRHHFFFAPVYGYYYHPYRYYSPYRHSYCPRHYGYY